MTRPLQETQLIGGPSYGFANQQKGVFSKLQVTKFLFGWVREGCPILYSVIQEEILSIVDCSDPDHMTPHERRVARIAHEEASFDAEYYLYVSLYSALYLGHIEDKIAFSSSVSPAYKATCA